MQLRGSKGRREGALEIRASIVGLEREVIPAIQQRAGSDITGGDRESLPKREQKGNAEHTQRDKGHRPER